MKDIESRGFLPRLRTIAQAHGVHPEEVIGRSRTKEICAARDEFAAWIRDTFGWSYPSIARLLGRDSTTVLYACRRVARG